MSQESSSTTQTPDQSTADKEQTVSGKQYLYLHDSISTHGQPGKIVHPNQVTKKE